MGTSHMGSGIYMGESIMLRGCNARGILSRSMLKLGNTRRDGTSPPISTPLSFTGPGLGDRRLDLRKSNWHGGCSYPIEENDSMQKLNYLRSSLFWEMKIKIAILTFVTFAALC